MADEPDSPDPVRAYTHHTTVTFTLKEGPQGQPRIMIEEYEPGLPVLKYGDGFLMMHFRGAVSFDEARALVAELNNKLDSISFTRFS